MYTVYAWPEILARRLVFVVMSLQSALLHIDTLCAIIDVLIMLNSISKCKSQTNNVSLHVPVITDVQRRYN